MCSPINCKKVSLVDCSPSLALMIIAFLRPVGFDSDIESLVYKIIMPIFVDDITLASKSQKALDERVEELAKHFPLRDLGPTSFLLGIHITRDFEKRTISLSQR